MPNLMDYLGTCCICMVSERRRIQTQKIEEQMALFKKMLKRDWTIWNVIRKGRLGRNRRWNKRTKMKFIKSLKKLQGPERNGEKAQRPSKLYPTYAPVSRWRVAPRHLDWSLPYAKREVLCRKDAE